MPMMLALTLDAFEAATYAADDDANDDAAMPNETRNLGGAYYAKFCAATVVADVNVA